MIFGFQSSIIYASVDIHIDIQAGISIQGRSTMDIREIWISTNGYPGFYGYQASIIHAFMDIHQFLRISMHGLDMDSRSRDFFNVKSFDILRISQLVDQELVSANKSACRPCNYFFSFDLFSLHQNWRRVQSEMMEISYVSLLPLLSRCSFFSSGFWFPSNGIACVSWAHLNCIALLLIYLSRLNMVYE